MPDQEIDLLVLILVSESQSKKLMANLNKKHFFFTIIDSASTLFHEPTVCLLLGLNHTRKLDLNRLVQKYCHPYRKYIPVTLRGSGDLSQLPVLESKEGGAILYALPVEHFEQV